MRTQQRMPADSRSQHSPRLSLRRKPGIRAWAVPRLARGTLLPGWLGWSALISALISPALLWAHPGELDEFGGHFQEKTGQYHYHRPKMDMAARKKETLLWLQHPNKGAIKGIVDRIERPNAVWIRVPYRPAFQELVPLISASNRDDKKQLLRVWLLFVSPEETGARGRKFTEWFNNKVVYELKRKLMGKEVSVQFQRLEGEAMRLRGMIFLGEENINLWLVLGGWSYYVIGEGANPADAQFRQAEDLARKNKSGIWAHEK